MGESTIVKTSIDGTLYLAALGGGAYNTSTGALLAGGEQYTVAFEAGDVSITLPSRAVSNYKDRSRTTSPPSLRYGADTEGSISFSAYFRDMTNATSPTLSDILATLAGNPSGVVGSSWESTSASAAGAGDAEVFSIAVKLKITNAGDGTDTHEMAFNYIVGTGTIYDPVDAYYLG